MNVLLSGALGHMGQAVQAVLQGTECTIVAGIDPSPALDAPFPIYPAPTDFLPEADILVDFSRPAALPELLAYATRKQLPLVLCATGYAQAQLQAIREAAQALPIFQASNISLGIALLKRLAQITQAFFPQADIEIVETHHRRKADAPSGTAIALYDALCAECRHSASYGRHGGEDRRIPCEIGIHAIRGGTVVGEHEVLFLGEGERISLKHTMETRNALAQGIGPILRFMAGKKPGLYTMDDLVGSIG